MSNTNERKRKELLWWEGKDSIELLDGLSPIIHRTGKNSMFVRPVTSPRHADIEKEIETSEPEHLLRKFNQ